MASRLWYMPPQKVDFRRKRDRRLSAPMHAIVADLVDAWAHDGMLIDGVDRYWDEQEMTAMVVFLYAAGRAEAARAQSEEGSHRRTLRSVRVLSGTPPWP